MNVGNKRAFSSTASEGDSSLQSLDISVFEESSQTTSKSKKKSKQDKKKQKTLDSFVEKMAGNETNKSGSESSIVKKLDELDAKLSNVLSKNDKTFIREIIKDTILEMKEQLLSSISRRLEILESDVHDRDIETNKLKNALMEKEKEIEKLKEHNNELKMKLNQDCIEGKRVANEQEQYSRKNNIRITGVPDDEEKEMSQTCIEKTMVLLNDKLNLNIHEADIGVAHRLGRFKSGKNRPVIVQFVRKQTKINVMKKTSALKGTGIFINHDLTKLNNEVLSSLRLKDKTRIERCWFHEGKIFAAFKDTANPEAESITRQILFKEFQHWIDLPWPEKTETLNSSRRASTENSGTSVP